MHEIDYDLRFSDRMLGVYRGLVGSAEARSKQLIWLSRLMGAFGDLPPESLSRKIDFSDGSRPLSLSTPIILAAGANKYGGAITGFQKMWYGGVTVGSVTRERREGNPHRPRVDLIEGDDAANNSMGLNNPGASKISDRVFSAYLKGRDDFSVGVSVAETPGLDGDGERLDDFIETFHTAREFADYSEVNVSCPNTGAGVVDQEYEFMGELFSRIRESRDRAPIKGSVFAKLSPGSDEGNLERTVGMAQDSGINGVVLFNAWAYEKTPMGFLQTKEADISVLTGDDKRGGISGAPLYPYVCDAVGFVKKSFPDMKVWGCGGIFAGDQLREMEDLGADAVQILTANAYRWMAAKTICNEYIGLRDN